MAKHLYLRKKIGMEVRNDLVDAYAMALCVFGEKEIEKSKIAAIWVCEAKCQKTSCDILGTRKALNRVHNQTLAKYPHFVDHFDRLVGMMDKKDINSAKARITLEMLK